MSIDERVDERLTRVLTQYRESPNVLGLLNIYLKAIASAGERTRNLPDRFDLDTATGDQLTLIGKALGWPRVHCVCSTERVFGFECDGVVNVQPIAGFCEEEFSTWSHCAITIGEIDIVDDEVYRSLLKSRVRQLKGNFNLESLENALKDIFGEFARVVSSGAGYVTVSPGRELTASETPLLQIYPRVLPVALGVKVLFHFDSSEIFGFGSGWGGFCDNGGEDAPWLCEVEIDVYNCA